CAAEIAAVGDETNGFARTAGEIAVALRESDEALITETTWRQLISLKVDLLGAQHPDIAETLGLLANRQLRQHHPDAAVATLRDALALLTHAYGENEI